MNPHAWRSWLDGLMAYTFVGKPVMKHLSLAILYLLASLAPAVAQTAGTGALAGTIADASGAVIPETKIVVTNEATGEVRQVMSQANGSFVVPLLPPGAYRIELSKTGFKTAVTTDLPINVTETARLDIVLQVGVMQDQVKVSTETQLLQTESNALGRVTDRTLVGNLPAAGSSNSRRSLRSHPESLPTLPTPATWAEAMGGRRRQLPRTRRKRSRQ